MVAGSSAEEAVRTSLRWRKGEERRTCNSEDFTLCVHRSSLELDCVPSLISHGGEASILIARSSEGVLSEELPTHGSSVPVFAEASKTPPLLKRAFRERERVSAASLTRESSRTTNDGLREGSSFDGFNFGQKDWEQAVWLGGALNDVGEEVRAEAVDSRRHWRLWRLKQAESS